MSKLFPGFRLAGIALSLFLTSIFCIESSAAVISCYPAAGAYNTGSVNNQGMKTQPSLMNIQGGNGERAWMKFDVSAIPDAATITGVKVIYYVSSQNYPYYELRRVTADPVTVAGQTLFTQIGTGTLYGTVMGPVNGLNTKILQANAHTDLQAALTDNWFAIGLYEYENTNYYFQDAEGWDEAHPPVLEVTYSLSVQNDIALDYFTHPAPWTCGGSLDVVVRIRNTGDNIINSAVMHWWVGGVSMPDAWFQGSLNPGAQQYFTLGTFTFLPGMDTLMAEAALPNGMTDPNPSNNVVLSSVLVLQEAGITAQPVNQAVMPGDTAVFAIGLTGSYYSFYWMVSIDGGNTYNYMYSLFPGINDSLATLTIPGVTLAMNAYLFRCMISSMCSQNIVSNPAMLSVVLNGALVSVPQVNGCQGDTLAVPVRVTQFDSVCSFELKLHVDTGLVQYIGFSAVNPGLPDISAVNPSVSLSGDTVILAYSTASPATLAGTQDLLWLHFFPTGPIAYCPFSWDPGSWMMNCLPDTLPVSFSDGGIQVHPGPGLFEVVTPQPANGHLCPGSNGAQIGLNGSQQGVIYSLYRDGQPLANYSYIYGTGNSLTFGHFGIPGTYSVYAGYPNLDCGAWMAGSVTVVIDSALQVFQLSGGGTYCQGANGVTISLGGSQQGILYMLTRNGVAVDTLAGTGQVLIIPNVTDNGQYAMTAFYPVTWSCATQMSGTAGVTLLPLPAAPGYFTGNDTVCAGSVVQFCIPQIQHATGYDWTVPAGTAIMGGGSYSNCINVHFTLQAVNGYITVSGHNACGNSPVASYPVYVFPRPLVDAGPNVTTSPGSPVVLTATASGGPPPFFFNWTNGMTGPVITVNPAQTTVYFVEVTNGAGCSAYDSVIVNVVQQNVIITSVSQLSACEGNVIIPVEVENFTNVASISLGLEYNDSVLTYSGYQNLHPALGTGIMVINGMNGIVMIAWYSITPAGIGNGIMLELLFAAVTGFSSLSWDAGVCIYTDINNATLPAVFIDGSINITGCGSLQGSVTYENAVATPLNNAVVQLSQSGIVHYSGQTLNSGDFQIDGIMDGTYLVSAFTAKPWGGGNAADALLILQHFVGLTNLTGLRLQAADLDGLNAVNAADALLVVKRFVGMVNDFPVGDWVFSHDEINLVGGSSQVADLQGICAGDVDASFTPSVKEESAVHVTHEGFCLSENGMVRIPVRTSGQLTAGAVSLVLEFPGDRLNITSVSMDCGSTLVYRVSGGILRLAWYSLNPVLLADDGVLLTLEGQLIPTPEPGLPILVEISPESRIHDTGAIPLDDVNLKIPVVLTGQKDFLVGNPLPNPSDGHFRIPVTLSEASDITIRIMDVTGKLVNSLNVQAVTAGYQEISLDLGPFAPGAYFLLIEASNGRYRQQVPLIIR